MPKEYRGGQERRLQIIVVAALLAVVISVGIVAVAFNRILGLTALGEEATGVQLAVTELTNHSYEVMYVSGDLEQSRRTWYASFNGAYDSVTNLLDNRYLATLDEDVRNNVASMKRYWDNTAGKVSASNTELLEIIDRSSYIPTLVPNNLRGMSDQLNRERSTTGTFDVEGFQQELRSTRRNLEKMVSETRALGMNTLERLNAGVDEAVKRTVRITIIASAAAVGTLIMAALITLIRALRMLRAANIDLTDRRKSVQALLDHSGEGFFSFGPDLEIHAETSQECENIFGRAIVGENAAVLLWDEEEDRENFRKAMDLVFTGNADADIVFRAIGRQIDRGDQIVSIGFRYVDETKVLGVMKDITEEEMLRRQVEKEREQQEMVLRALVERNSYFALLNEAEELFSEIHRVIGGVKIDTETDEYTILIRDVHTFKANAGFLYMAATADAAHHFETALEDAMFLEDSDPVDEVAAELRRAFNTEVEIISNALGHGWMQHHEIHEVKLGTVERALWLAKQNHQDDAELIEILDEMARVPLAQLFNRYQEIAPQLAARRGKMVKVQVEHNGIAVPHEVFTCLNDSLNHMIRNIIDHGIEIPRYREQAGKDPYGEIRLAARADGNELIVHVSDDGAGIDCDKVRERAKELGWIESGVQLGSKEITQLLFRDGFSTAMVKTATSGRGVGLSAVLRRIKGMGGAILLSTRQQEGTEFKLKLPMVAVGVVAHEGR